MSNFKSVLDFLQGASKAINHEEIYERLLEKASNGRLDEMDLSKLEECSLGIGEMNILRDLEMMDKFIYKGMDERMVISSTSLSKQRDKGIGKGSLQGSRDFEENYLLDETLVVRPSMQWLAESGKRGTQIPRNTALFRSLLSTVIGSTLQNMTGSSLSLIGECLISSNDLRYMFLKGYLALMSYNLAVTAGVKKGKSRKLNVMALSNITANEKVSVLLQYNVVIDTAHFTREEKWFLAEMGNEYPIRQYGSKNIYNNLMLEKDEVIFISEGTAFEKDETEPGFGSPERMWNMLISIATKLKALDALFEVVRDFRGLPCLLRSVYELTDKDEFIVKYPKSRSLVSAIEDELERRPVIKRYSGFFSTSKNLVSDLLVGRMMEMSIFNILEEVGAFGDFGVPEQDAKTDRFFLSTLRNYALRSDDEGENAILQEWRGVRGCSMVVSLSGKVLKMASMIADKVRKKDTEFLRPQLLFALPYSAFKNTTWGTIRGWRYNDFKFSDTNAERRMMSRRTRAYCWVMGVTKEVPTIGLNAIGVLQSDNLKHAELEFLKMGSGVYDISMVRHGLGVDVDPRTDEYELTSSVFYLSSFPGTRCSVVFDAGGNNTLVIESKVDMFLTETVPETEEGDGYGPPSHTVPQISFGGSERGKWNTVKNSVHRIIDEFGGVHPDTKKDEPEKKTGRDSPEKSETAVPPQSHIRGYASKRWKPPRKLYDEDGNEVTTEIENSVNGSEEDEGGEEQRKATGEGEDTSKKSNVEVTPKGILPFRRKRLVERVDGKIKPRKIDVEGLGMKEVVINSERVVNPNSVRGYVIKTPGDGTCGIHAVIQDLAIYGYVSEGEKKEEYHAMLDSTPSGVWHQQEELASYVNLLNMGLVIVAPEERTVYRYGATNSDHNVTIIRDRGHFSTFVPDDYGNVSYSGFNLSDGGYTPRESVEAAEAVLAGLENPAMAEEIRARMSRTPKQRDWRDDRGYRDGGRGRRQYDDRRQPYGYGYGRRGGRDNRQERYHDEYQYDRDPHYDGRRDERDTYGNNGRQDWYRRWK